MYPAAVTHVLSAHHGECGPASRRVFARRAAQLFAHPIPYYVYNCMSWTEAQLLSGGCATRHSLNNTVFVTFKTAQTVTFVQNGHYHTAQVRTFGSTWDGRRAILYFTNLFPNLPRPPGSKPYTGPQLFGLFGAVGDPLRLQEGECPTDDGNRT